MENGKRRAEDEGVLIEFNPQKRVRHELIEFEPNDKDGAVMEVEVSVLRQAKIGELFFEAIKQN